MRIRGSRLIRRPRRYAAPLARQGEMRSGPKTTTVLDYVSVPPILTKRFESRLTGALSVRNLQVPYIRGDSGIWARPLLLCPLL